MMFLIILMLVFVSFNFLFRLLIPKNADHLYTRINTHIRICVGICFIIVIVVIVTLFMRMLLKGEVTIMTMRIDRW